MPQAQVIDLGRDQSKGKGLMGFLNQLGDSYKENKDKQEFESLINEYQQNKEDEGAFENLVTKTMQSNMGPKARIKAYEDLDKMQTLIGKNQEMLNNKLKAKEAKVKEENKKEADKKVSYEILRANGVEEKEATRLAEFMTPANTKDYLDPKQGSDKLDKFDEKLQSKGGEEYVKLQESIAKGKDAITNLDYLESLSENELSGLKGYAKSALNLESAAEFSNIAFTTIEPIIKLFNPVGPIPVAKMKMIQQTFQMHPGELRSTIRGKISSLKRIGEQALARNEQRAALLRKHKGLIPEEELKQFDQQSKQLENAIIEQEAFNIKMEGKKDDEMIDGLYGKNGKKLKPMTKKQALEYYNQGLINSFPSEFYKQDETKNESQQ